MNYTIERANELHYEALAVVKAAVKAGIKIKKGSNLISKYIKGTINKKSGEKPVNRGELKGLNPTAKVKFMLARHKELTRIQLVTLTGLSTCSISRAARTLEDEGFLTRGPSGQGVGREVLFSVVGS